MYQNYKLILSNLFCIGHKNIEYYMPCDVLLKTCIGYTNHKYDMSYLFFLSPPRIRLKTVRGVYNLDIGPISIMGQTRLPSLP